MAERTKYNRNRRGCAPESAQIGQSPLDDITYRLRIDRQKSCYFFGHQVLKKTEVNDFLLPGWQLVDRRPDLYFQSQIVFPPNPVFLARKFGHHVFAFIGQSGLPGKWPDRFQHPVPECLDKVEFDGRRVVDRRTVEPEVYQQILDHIFYQLHVTGEPLAILEKRPVVPPGKFRIRVLVPTTERIPKHGIVGMFAKCSQKGWSG